MNHEKLRDNWKDFLIAILWFLVWLFLVELDNPKFKKLMMSVIMPKTDAEWLAEATSFESSNPGEKQYQIEVRRSF